MRVLLLGPPGAGKGTLGEKLAAYYSVPHVAAGELIREHIARGTEFGRRVERQIAAGNFAADADIIYWVCERLAEPGAAQGYILDGFPRNIVQARAFGETCAAFDAVLELEASKSVLQERLTARRVCQECGRTYNADGTCHADGARLVRRPDDGVDAVARRMKVYELLTAPLREWYAAEGLLRTIDASADAETVFDSAVCALRDWNAVPKIVRAGV